MQEPRGFTSLAELHEAHAALSEQRDEHGLTEETLQAAQRFVLRGVAVGTWLHAAADRRNAQSLLDYWVTVLDRAGQPPRSSTLLRFDAEAAPLLDDGRCPYVGLNAFDRQDHARFFGRAAVVQQLVTCVEKTHLVAVVGPSGSGKSSLVRAGLMPALEREAQRTGQRLRITRAVVPGSDPLPALVEAMEEADTDAPEGGPSRIVDASWPTLVVIDQFEEIFTLCESQERRQRFIEYLLVLTRSPTVRMVLTMRNDFVPFLEQFPEFYELFKAGWVRVTPLSAAELREAIEQPAAAVGLKFDPEVVNYLLNDLLGEPAGLPLLQFTLLQLWRQRQRNRVSLATYRAVGGGRDALQRCAEEVYSRLIPEDKETAKRILVRLGRAFGSGSSDEVTRSRVRVVDLLGREDPERVRRVLDRLLEARLLRATAGKRPEEEQIEVAHEALVRSWPRLVGWLEEQSEQLRTQRRLESRATEWVRLGKGDGGLLDHVELLEAERWQQGAEQSGEPPAIGALAELIRASRLAVDRDMESERRTARRLRALAFVLFSLLVVVGVLLFNALRLRKEALKESLRANLAAEQAKFAELQATVAANTAKARHLSLNSVLVREQDPELAVLLAREAVDMKPSLSTWTALYTAIKDVTPNRVLDGHPGGVLGAWFESAAARSHESPSLLTVAADGTARRFATDGRPLFALAWPTEQLAAVSLSRDGGTLLTVAAASPDKAGGQPAKLWLLGGETVTQLLQFDMPATGGAVSPDGTKILLFGEEPSVRLYSRDGQLLQTLEAHKERVVSASWSPDGTRMLTTSRDRTAIIWHSDPKKLPITLKKHLDSVFGGAWSPDGTQVLTVSRDRSAVLWDERGTPLATLIGHTEGLSGGAFGPDGHSVVTCGLDQTARLWSSGGRQLAVLKGHTAEVVGCSFSPDGKQVLTQSLDGTVRLWAPRERAVQTLRGHDLSIKAGAWSPDGAKLVTASMDRTAQVWSRDGSLLATLRGHDGAVVSAAWGPDGQIVTAGWDSTARVWDASGRLVATLMHTLKAAQNDFLSSASWSPDGRRILTTTWGRKVWLWDPREPRRPVAQLNGHRGQVDGGSFSPDGSRILTTARDDTARLWTAEGEPIAVLRGHTDGVSAGAWSPDGEFVLTTSIDRTARLWRRTGELVGVLRGHTGAVLGGAWSQDGHWILTVSQDKTAKLWTREGHPVRTLSGHEAAVSRGAFSPDGGLILTLSSDRTARLWTPSGEPLLSLTGNDGPINDGSFSPDGQRVLTVAADGVARLWPTDRDKLYARLKEYVTRDLSPTERKRYTDFSEERVSE